MLGGGFMSNANTSLKNNRVLNSRERSYTIRYLRKHRTKGTFEFRRDEKALLKIRKKIKRRRQIKIIKRVILTVIVLIMAVFCFYWAS